MNLINTIRAMQLDEAKEPSVDAVKKVMGPTKNSDQGIKAIMKAFKVDKKKAEKLLHAAIKSDLGEELELDEATFEMYSDPNSDNWGESDGVGFGRRMGYKEVGVCSTKSDPVGYMVLFALNSQDKKDVKGTKLKSGEYIYRYSSHGTRIGKMLPLVKINPKRGLLYFLTAESFRGEIDRAEFDTRGEKLAFLRLISGTIREETNLEEGAFPKMGSLISKDDEEYWVSWEDAKGQKHKEKFRVAKGTGKDGLEKSIMAKKTSKTKSIKNILAIESFKLDEATVADTKKVKVKVAGQSAEILFKKAKKVGPVQMYSATISNPEKGTKTVISKNLSAGAAVADTIKRLGDVYKQKIVMEESGESITENKDIQYVYRSLDGSKLKQAIANGDVDTAKTILIQNGVREPALSRALKTISVQEGAFIGEAQKKGPYNLTQSLLDAVRDVMQKERDHVDDEKSKGADSKKDDKPKMDKVNKKELKKDFDDRKDKDIDNDGNEDDSDEYLHKKRQAVSKEIEKKSKPKDPENNRVEPVADNKSKEDKTKEKEYAKNKSNKKEKIDTEPTMKEEMTPAQEKKREDIVKSMKDKKAEFDAKYGKRAKDVMYATATKLATKEDFEWVSKEAFFEDVEELDELSTGTLDRYHDAANDHRDHVADNSPKKYDDPQAKKRARGMATAARKMEAKRRAEREKAGYKSHRRIG